MIEVELKTYKDGSCMYCTIDEQYDSLDPKTMRYVGPYGILHIRFEDARQHHSYATLRVCPEHLRALDAEWDEKVSVQR